MLDNSFPSKYEIYGGKSLRLEVCKALEMFYSTPNLEPGRDSACDLGEVIFI